MHYRSHHFKLITTTLLFSLWGQAVVLPVQLIGIILKTPDVLAQTPTSQTQEVEAKQLLQEGVTQFNRGQVQAALEKFQQALAIYQEIGDRTNIAVSLNNIGEAYRQLGQYSQALESYKQALRIRR